MLEKGTQTDRVIQIQENKIKILLEFLLEREKCLVHAVLSCGLHTIACAALKAKAFAL